VWQRLHEVLLSASESFVDGPAQGLRSVRTTRDAARLNEVPRELDERLGLPEGDFSHGLEDWGTGPAGSSDSSSSRVTTSPRSSSAGQPAR